MGPRRAAFIARLARARARVEDAIALLERVEALGGLNTPAGAEAGRGVFHLAEQAQADADTLARLERRCRAERVYPGDLAESARVASEWREAQRRYQEAFRRVLALSPAE